MRRDILLGVKSASHMMNLGDTLIEERMTVASSDCDLNMQERAWLLPRLPYRKKEMRTRRAVLGKLPSSLILLAQQKGKTINPKVNPLFCLTTLMSSGLVLLLVGNIT